MSWWVVNCVRHHGEVASADSALWDGAYDLGDVTRSWYQELPTQSLRMVAAAGVASADSVIDVGGGASTLVDGLLARGFHDITVLDISATGLQVAQHRLANDASRVQWIVADLLTWVPARTYAVWHDRAVFHFMTSASAQGKYLKVLHAATTPGSVAVIGCFALDGPRSCSGLPVVRYDAVGLTQQLGEGWALIHDERQDHATPAGAVQPFTWAAFRRR